MRGKAHRPTDESRENVRRWAASGVDQCRMAKALGISDDTLRVHYREECDLGGAQWEVDFEASLGRRVFSPLCPPAVLIFLAKVRLGYRELTAKDPDRNVEPEEMSDDQLRRAIAARAGVGSAGPRGVAAGKRKDVAA